MSRPQAAVVVGTLVLFVATFVYVPYSVPGEDDVVYGWIWARPTYTDPFEEAILDEAFREELRRQLRDNGYDPDIADRGGPTRHEAWIDLSTRWRNMLIALGVGGVALVAVRLKEIQGS